jgi:hypothetical protein
VGWNGCCCSHTTRQRGSEIGCGEMKDEDWDRVFEPIGRQPVRSPSSSSDSDSPKSASAGRWERLTQARLAFRSWCVGFDHLVCLSILGLLTHHARTRLLLQLSTSVGLSRGSADGECGPHVVLHPYGRVGPFSHSQGKSSPPFVFSFSTIREPQTP